MHIPYCTKKCSYCDFYSTTLSTKSEILILLNRILDDTTIFLKKMGSPTIRTLFIGGGTPSAVRLNMLEIFLHKLMDIIGKSPLESTIELNPESVTVKLLKILFNNGINRKSVGFQSLHDNILKTLGRNTNVKINLEALNIIQKYWRGSFSVDLINTVPGQTVNSAVDDINKIQNFDPDHISLYNLTFEPSTKLFSLLKSGKINRLNESIDLDMQTKSIDLLQLLGYERYEVSNFAKKGKQSLHNINYWEMGSYLGIGPSAASTLLSEKGPVRIEYKRSISNYVSDSTFNDRINFEYLDSDTFLLEHLMMGLRLKEGINIIKINNIFNMNIINFLKPLSTKWKDILIIDKESIYLSKNGLSFLNQFLIDIATLIDHAKTNLTNKEINWPILTAHF
ncbi:MAG: radical SAM family heme chaperone HemW [Spirochaetia bacterium]|nr:radical SAM family heme chaperone HemW [Spirochaetia bacterium]